MCDTESRGDHGCEDAKSCFCYYITGGETAGNRRNIGYSRCVATRWRSKQRFVVSVCAATPRTCLSSCISEHPLRTVKNEAAETLDVACLLITLSSRYPFSTVNHAQVFS